MQVSLTWTMLDRAKEKVEGREGIEILKEGVKL